MFYVYRAEGYDAHPNIGQFRFFQRPSYREIRPMRGPPVLCPYLLRSTLYDCTVCVYLYTPCIVLSTSVSRVDVLYPKKMLFFILAPFL